MKRFTIGLLLTCAIILSGAPTPVTSIGTIGKVAAAKKSQNIYRISRRQRKGYKRKAYRTFKKGDLQNAKLIYLALAYSFPKDSSSFKMLGLIYNSLKDIDKRNKCNLAYRLVRKRRRNKIITRTVLAQWYQEIPEMKTAKVAPPTPKKEVKKEEKAANQIKIKKDLNGKSIQDKLSDQKKINTKKIPKIRDRKAMSFKAKLSLMLSYINKSLEIIKEQITHNQNAPFLADLYMELGSLYSQKANALYYIQMERMGSDTAANTKKSFKIVIEASKEAIATYELLIKDFPSFPKRAEVLYLLAVTNQAIDNEAKFMVITEKLIKDFPKSEEAMKGRMLLGKHHFIKGDYKDALKMFDPISKSKFNFVKNQAIYNMGQVYIRQGKYKKALNAYRRVILDKKLEKHGAATEIAIKDRQVKTSLKREALLDSVQPFTYLYPNHKNPASYYAKIAPTETLFQEIVQKLAFRYINLKKYQTAIRLLRVLSERSIDPEKVINIYQEVLTMIPLSKRLHIEVKEIRFVLEKFNFWFSYYKLHPKLQLVGNRFLEIQLRELGTRNHDEAKKKRIKYKPKMRYLKKAIAFYQMYLGTFPKHKNAIKMAINLADVYYRMKRYPESGSYYLRVANNEFGVTSHTKKKLSIATQKELILNALNALQKQKIYTFYDQTWRRGLLLKSIGRLMNIDKTKRKDADLNFLMARTQFEQGLHKKALDNLYKFMQKFPNSKYVADAGDLILSYFNTSGDYAGLDRWSAKLLKLKFADQSFKKRLEVIRKQAKLKTLDSDIKTVSGYDDFYQSRSYYKFALQTDDPELKNIALEQALQRSRDERDIETFFTTALTLAKQEKDPKKSLPIYKSVANEYLLIARYPSASKAYANIYNNKKYPEKERLDAFFKGFSITLGLKDFPGMIPFIKNPFWRKVSPDLKEQVLQVIAGALNSEVKVPKKLVTYLIQNSSEALHLLSFYKSQKQLDSSTWKVAQQKINNLCREEDESVCYWLKMAQLEQAKDQYLKKLRASSAPGDIGPLGNGFVALKEPYEALFQTEDGQLKVLVAIRMMELFKELGTYLNRAAAKGGPDKAALQQNATSSLNTAKEYSKACYEISKNAEVYVGITSYCAEDAKPLLFSDVFKRTVKPLPTKVVEYNQGDPLTLQKQMLVDKNGDTYLELADAFLSEKKYRLANAVAMYGLNLFSEKSDNFTAILGCATMKLGLLNEAKFHLSGASDYQGLKTKCLQEIDALQGGKQDE